MRVSLRHTHRSGKDKVEHPKNGHDDHANVACGVINLIAQAAREQPMSFHVPFVAGTLRNIPGQSYGVGAGEIAPLLSAAPVAPAGAVAPVPFASDPRNYVLPDGSISPTPIGGGRKYWGPV
jgi:hypothetical protein